jgi:alpha-tubulin suppressor-like RCC1 family protein
VATPGPSAEIADAAHSLAIEHFYFLPPMVPDPTVEGAFDGSLSPQVEVCELVFETSDPPQVTDCLDLGPEPALFTMDTGPGSETVRMEPANEHYVVNWHTDEFVLDDQKTYRIIVSVAGTVLGYADVDAVSGGNQLKNVDTDEYILLKDGRTLPIKFRIEEGAVFVVGSDPVTITAEDGDVVLDVPAGALSEEVGITVDPVTDLSGIPAEVQALQGSVYEFGPDGTTFDEPVDLTLSFDEAQIPPDADITRLAIYTEENGQWIELPTVIDFDANTVTAQIEGFSTKAVGVTGGGSHTCALVNGDAFCWGDNRSGQLGDGTLVSSARPVQVQGDPYDEISAGQSHTCARKSSGTVECWGSGANGQLGNGTTTRRQPTPVQVQGGPYDEIAAGFFHTCGRKSSGTVECWGSGANGQLGNGTTTRRQPTPVQVQGGPFDEIRAGGSTTCGRQSSGMVECWGWGANGQRGDGTTTLRQSTPVQVQGGPYDEISIGFDHACGRQSSGTVECWGRGNFGQRGDGTTTNKQSIPVQVQGGPYDEIALGGYHTCGRQSSGTVECWGYGANGQLGNGSTSDQTIPGAVLGGPYDAIAAGYWTTCGVTPAGAIECWGGNWAGQAGTGSAGGAVTSPSPVQGLPDPTPPITPLLPSPVSAGASHTCQVTQAGDIECWGSGPLGNGMTFTETAPVKIEDPPQGPQTWARVSSGGGQGGGFGRSSCALTTSGDIYCWGFGTVGQLGNGGNVGINTPVATSDPIEGPQTWTGVSMGETHACAVNDVGDVYCWGSNDVGQLGDGGTSNGNIPQKVVDSVDGPQTYVIVSAAQRHTCAITRDGSAFCWGSGGSFNRLGNTTIGGGVTSEPVPVTVAGMRKFVSLEAANSHTCGITTDDGPYCWGSGGNGRSGISGSLSGLKSISTGLAHSCAVTFAGEAWCTGLNNAGQLGDGTNSQSGTPVMVEGGHLFESISAGGSHTCAIRDDGETMCWGFNSSGQLADGTMVDRNEPVLVGSTPVDPDMAALWTLDDGAGQVAAELVAGLDGQLGSTTGADINDPTWIPGRFGGALQIDRDGSTPLGSSRSEYVLVPNDPSLEPTQISVEAWMRMAAYPGDFSYPLRKGIRACAHAGYGFVTSSGRMHFLVARDIPDNTTTRLSEGADASTGIYDGQWHHIVGTYDELNLRLYVDGVEVGTGTPHTQPIRYNLATDNDLYIGAYEESAGCRLSWKGDIDEVAIWNRALTASEVAARAAR